MQIQIRTPTNVSITLEVDPEGADTIADVKAKLALALPGIPPEQQLLEWNGKALGRLDADDPTDESLSTLADAGVLNWLSQYPAWSLSLRLLPPAPKDPAVAIKVLLLLAPREAQRSNPL
jgi:hypothetical protein